MDENLADDDSESEEGALIFLELWRGGFPERIIQREGVFWIEWSFGEDFGPYDTWEEAVEEPVDGPIGLLTPDVTDIHSGILSADEILPYLCNEDVNAPPYVITINAEKFEVRGKIIARHEQPPSRD